MEDTQRRYPQMGKTGPEGQLSKGPGVTRKAPGHVRGPGHVGTGTQGLALRADLLLIVGSSATEQNPRGCFDH